MVGVYIDKHTHTLTHRRQFCKWLGELPPSPNSELFRPFRTLLGDTGTHSSASKLCVVKVLMVLVVFLRNKYLTLQHIGTSALALRKYCFGILTLGSSQDTLKSLSQHRISSHSHPPASLSSPSSSSSNSLPITTQLQPLLLLIHYCIDTPEMLLMFSHFHLVEILHQLLLLGNFPEISVVSGSNIAIEITTEPPQALSPHPLPSSHPSPPLKHPLSYPVTRSPLSALSLTELGLVVLVYLKILQESSTMAAVTLWEQHGGTSQFSNSLILLIK